jgi:hypothetical protein
MKIPIVTARGNIISPITTAGIYEGYLAEIAATGVENRQLALQQFGMETLIAKNNPGLQWTAIALGILQPVSELAAANTLKSAAASALRSAASPAAEAAETTGGVAAATSKLSRVVSAISQHYALAQPTTLVGALGVITRATESVALDPGVAISVTESAIVLQNVNNRGTRGDHVVAPAGHDEMTLGVM